MGKKILKNIDHIGIVTSDIKNIGNIVKLLELEFITKGKSCGAKCVFYKSKGPMIEFIEPITNESIKKFIQKYGDNKLHHVAFKVDNLKEAIAHFKRIGQLITFEDEKSADGKSKIAFLHPKTTGGTLIELVQ